MANDGGSAFPRQHTVADANDPAFKFGHDGMTLRDYFAAKALMALDIQAHVAPPAAKHLASSAYNIADAMLAERSK
jgi:hypothetical protein